MGTQGRIGNIRPAILFPMPEVSICDQDPKYLRAIPEAREGDPASFGRKIPQDIRKAGGTLRRLRASCQILPRNNPIEKEAPALRGESADCEGEREVGERPPP